MELHAELARFNADPALQEWVSGTLDRLLEEARRDAAAIHAANLKIQALTLELAQLRRMRFGVRSEALSAAQRELFAETLASDLAATAAELEAQPPTHTAARAGRQPLPEHLPRIEHRHEPGELQLRPVRQGAGEDRRGRERTARCRAGALLCASAHPPPIRLP